MQTFPIRISTRMESSAPVRVAGGRDASAKQPPTRAQSLKRRPGSAEQEGHSTERRWRARSKIPRTSSL